MYSSIETIIFTLTTFYMIFSCALICPKKDGLKQLSRLLIQTVSFKRFFWCNKYFLMSSIYLSQRTYLVDLTPMGTVFRNKHTQIRYDSFWYAVSITSTLKTITDPLKEIKRSKQTQKRFQA